MTGTTPREEPKLNKLIAKYPQFFAERNCGFHCGDGWVPIIERACALINRAVNNVWCDLAVPDPETKAICDRLPDGLVEFQFDQIKEKFGGLRLYYHTKTKEYDILPDKEKFLETTYQRKMEGLHNTIGGIIAMAEAMAGITCEISGNPGELHTHSTSGWMKTLSPAVAAAEGFQKDKTTEEDTEEE